VLVEGLEHAAEVVDPRDARHGRGQEVVDGDQQAADQAPARRERLRRDGDDAAALGIAPADLDVLRGEQQEAHQRCEHEQGRRVADLVVEHPRDVVDRGADVAEHHRPHQERRELSQVRFARRCASLAVDGRGIAHGKRRGDPDFCRARWPVRCAKPQPPRKNA
jgi:hypothetical protein